MTAFSRTPSVIPTDPTPPEAYWYVGVNPTADMVVFRTINRMPHVLLIRRGGVTEHGKWALPGGFINTSARKGQRWMPGKESPLDAAIRETREETQLNLTSIRDTISPVGIYEGQQRDPRDTPDAWARSYAFGVVVPDTFVLPSLRATDDASRVQWQDLRQLSSLAYDHAFIIHDAQKLLFSPSGTRPVLRDARYPSFRVWSATRSSTRSEGTPRLP